MDHTAVSATQASSDWQHGTKKNCNFTSFNRIVDKKTSIMKMGPNILNFGYKINRKGLKGKYNLHYGKCAGRRFRAATLHNTSCS